MSTVINHIRWFRLAIGLAVTTVGALSVHSIMLQSLHVPFPDLSAITPPYKFLIRTIAMLGLIFLGHLTSGSFRGSFMKRWAALFLIDAMLTESLFRAPFMDGYCTTAWTYSFVGNISKLLAVAVICAMIVLAIPRLSLLWHKLAAAVTIAALFTYVVTPLMKFAMQPIMNFISNLAPQSEWCALPYGANVLVPAYLTFLELVIACYAAAALAWKQLSRSRTVRYLQFTLLILAVKNQLLTPFIYVAFAKTPAFPALASEGQFALEALALAALTCVFWDWALNSKSRRPLKRKRAMFHGLGRGKRRCACNISPPKWNRILQRLTT
jgi:hypothetical protein